MKHLKMLSVVLLAAVLLVGSVIVPSLGTAVSADAATIAISSKAITLDVGTSKALKINGTRNKITWSSSNRSVATVTSSGTVTAKASGSATITASVSGKKLTCKITAVKPIKISNSTYTLAVGTTKKLTISGTGSKIAWSSSNTKVATVSSWGTITPAAAGSATITASVAGKKLTCSLTVTNPKLSKKSYSLETGKTYKLVVTGSTNKVTWTSSDKSVATVSSYGTITAKAAGTTTIIAAVDGKTLSCALTVVDPAKLSDSSFTMEAGTTQQITVTGSFQNIIWSSGDTSVASVSSTGLITAIAAGNTLITADVDGKKLTCAITVNAPNPYVVNAPFSAKEWKATGYTVVTPDDWTAYFTTASGTGLPASFVTFDAADGSYVNIGIYDTGESAPDYTTAKEAFLSELNEADIRQKFTDAFTNMGITDYSLTDFGQSDFVSDNGNVFKTEYTLTVMGTSTKQIIYDYYLGDKLVEVSATDAGSELEPVADYIVNSLKLN